MSKTNPTNHILFLGGNVMKRVFVISTLTLLIVSLFSFGFVSAQGIWNTGVDVQNLSGTEGTVTIQFYNDQGGDAGSLSRTIAAWGSLNFYLPTESAPASGKYSAVVSSDVQIGATASQANYDLGGSDIYLGTTAPESILSFPLVYRNHTSGRWNTELIIQNASSAAQNITLYLYNAGQTSPAYTSSPVSIPAYASRTFDLSASTYAAFGPYGSATVQGSAPLAGVATNIRNAGTGKLNVINTSYRAFGAAQQGQNIVMPLVYKNYNLWTTGVNVLNKGSAETTVTITYKNANPSISGGPWTETMVLGANAMNNFYTPSSTVLPDSFYGSATITSSATDVAVVVASQRYRSDGAQGVAYEGSLPTDATACVSLPVVHNRTTWKTGINILNMDDSLATVTINYYSSAPGVSNATQTVQVPANSPLSVYMPGGVTALGFYGAADIKSIGGQRLLVNAAHSRFDQGVSSNFVGINYTCP